MGVGMVVTGLVQQKPHSVKNERKHIISLKLLREHLLLLRQ